MGPTTSILLRGAAELLTCARDAPDLIGRILGGDVLIENGRISAAGRLEGARAARVIDVTGRVVMPGFVDCHTHVVFGGTRVDEYAARVAGRTPEDGEPVGIVGTMTETRGLTVEALVAAAEPRVREMLEHGTTTLESKSGYGLRADAELRMLRANRALGDRVPTRIVSTYLGAHAFPPDTTREGYVRQILDTIPEVARAGLADFCDAYCDDGYFSVEETRRILRTGIEHGLAPKLHLDAYSHTGAAAVAAELGATSVDHLNYTAPEELERLAAAGVTAVAMPCLDLAADHPRPVRPRSLADAGIRVALATDICPGCWVTSMQLVVQLACRLGGLSVAQALRGATLDAAAAVGLEAEVGSLEPGKQADVIVLDVPRHEDVAYRIGRNAVERVISGGRVVEL